MSEVADKIIEMCADLAHYIEEEKAKTSVRRSRTDMLVNDIYHEIEFSNYNAVDGYKVYKRLKDALIERRKAKDDELLLADINTHYFEDIQSKLYIAMNKLDEREYQNRIVDVVKDEEISVENRSGFYENVEVIDGVEFHKGRKIIYHCTKAEATIYGLDRSDSQNVVIRMFKSPRKAAKWLKENFTSMRYTTETKIENKVVKSISNNDDYNHIFWRMVTQ